MIHVEAAKLSAQAGLSGPIHEHPVLVAMEQLHGRTVVAVRGEDIQAAVVVEVVHDDPTGRRKGADPARRRNVAEMPDVLGRCENRRRNPVPGGHARRVSAGRHMCCVQQPFRLEVIRIAVEQREKVPLASYEIVRLCQRSARLERQQAAISRLSVNPVLHLGLVHVGDAERLLVVRHCPRVVHDGQAMGLFGTPSPPAPCPLCTRAVVPATNARQ